MPTPERSTTSTLLLPLTFLGRAPFEPLITAPLLLTLLYGPNGLRNRLLAPLHSTILSPTSRVSVTLPTLLSTLKWLVGLGLASRINRLLTTLTLNHGTLTPQGKPWNFTKEKRGRDEVILITGACAGFGLNMVKMFSARAPEAKLIVLDISDLPAELKSIKNLTYYKCDLTSQSELESTCDTILNSSPPTVLINNAGIAKAQTIMECSQEWLQKMFTINVFCHYTLIQKFVPPMLQSQHGHVVTLASLASYLTTPGLVDYCASKAAVLALHEGLTSELHHRYPSGRTIQTTSIHPTFARTALTGTWTEKLKGQKVLEPEEVADAIVRRVMAGKGGGQVYLPAGFAGTAGIRGWPVWLAEWLRGRVETAVRLAG